MAFDCEMPLTAPPGAGASDTLLRVQACSQPRALLMGYWPSASALKAISAAAILYWQDLQGSALGHLVPLCFNSLILHQLPSWLPSLMGVCTWLLLSGPAALCAWAGLASASAWTACNSL